MALITARAGSKRLPRKNTLDIAGKPMVEWTVDAAVNSKLLNRVVVSTDGLEIARICKNAGAEIPFIRPETLAEGDTPHIEVVLHTLDWMRDNEKYEPDAVCLLQPTSPLRISKDIDGAIEKYYKLRPEAIISVSQSLYHPVFMRKIDKNTHILKEIVENECLYQRHQDLSETYYVNGAIYLNSTLSLRESRTFYPAGSVAYIMPFERSLQVDSLYELQLARWIMKEGKELPEIFGHEAKGWSS
jgi:CMP-N,N'-diacetyllegionaminic acid synthase